VALAALGLGLHQLTGDPRCDAAASIAVGAVLVGIAFELGRDSKSLLLGEGAYPEEVRRCARCSRRMTTSSTWSTC
jgi:divalent metal cation (Fe/Co/Zn/Cd) transporter